MNTLYEHIEDVQTRQRNTTHTMCKHIRTIQSHTKYTTRQAHRKHTEKTPPHGLWDDILNATGMCKNSNTQRIAKQKKRDTPRTKNPNSIEH